MLWLSPFLLSEPIRTCLRFAHLTRMPSGCLLGEIFSGMSNWEETPGQTPDMLEILHLSAALGTPLYSPDEAKVVGGEMEVHTYLLTQRSGRKRMDVFIHLFPVFLNVVGLIFHFICAT